MTHCLPLAYFWPFIKSPLGSICFLLLCFYLLFLDTKCAPFLLPLFYNEATKWANKPKTLSDIELFSLQLHRLLIHFSNIISYHAWLCMLYLFLTFYLICFKPFWELPFLITFKTNFIYSCKNMNKFLSKNR